MGRPIREWANIRILVGQEHKYIRARRCTTSFGCAWSNTIDMAHGEVHGHNLGSDRATQRHSHGHQEDTRLHILCKEGNYKKVEEFILTSRADLPSKLAYHQGVFGYTPIHEAVSSGHSKVLKLLLEQKTDPNCRANSGYTPLHLAASSGHVDCVRVLLANNADISNTDEYGKTPLQSAEMSSKHDIAKVLRSAGEWMLFYL